MHALVSFNSDPVLAGLVKHEWRKHAPVFMQIPVTNIWGSSPMKAVPTGPLCKCWSGDIAPMLLQLRHMGIALMLQDFKDNLVPDLMHTMV